MSLYVRVQNNFWTHRKTMRLKTKIGEDAFWIVPKLWSIAAEHQPDGDFSSYTSEELGMLIGCDKHATSIKDSLIFAGFMDSDGELHDWDEHNGYHAAFAGRAKKAADARWAKKKGKEKKGKETSIASSMLQASEEAFERCWKLYPNTSGSKHKALEAYKKAGPLEADVIAGIDRYKAFVASERKRGFKDLNYANGQTWFNQRRWESEYEVDTSKATRPDGSPLLEM